MNPRDVGDSLVYLISKKNLQPKNLRLLQEGEVQVILFKYDENILVYNEEWISFVILKEYDVILLMIKAVFRILLIKHSCITFIFINNTYFFIYSSNWPSLIFYRTVNRFLFSCTKLIVAIIILLS